MPKTQKKILYLLTGVKLSGAEKRTIRFFRAIQGKELDYDLAIGEGLYNQAVKNEEFSIVIEELEKASRLHILKTPKLLKKIHPTLGKTFALFLVLFRRPKKYWCIHSVLNHFPGILCSFIFKPKIVVELTGPNDVPLILAAPNIIFEEANLKEVKLSRLRHTLLARVDRFACVSRSVEDRFLLYCREMGLADYKNKSFRYSVPFYQTRAVVNNVREKENMIVYASYFNGRKNPILAAKGIGRFLESNAAWKVAFLGGGPEEERVKEIFAAANERGQVELIGRVPNLKDFLLRAKIYVSVITPDNYPSQSVLEAMDAKAALLCSDAGESWRFVENQNGCLVEFNEIEIEKKLNFLAADEAALKDMGERSADLLKEKFSQDIFIQDVKSLHDEIRQLIINL